MHLNDYKKEFESEVILPFSVVDAKPTKVGLALAPSSSASAWLNEQPTTINGFEVGGSGTSIFQLVPDIFSFNLSHKLWQISPPFPRWIESISWTEFSTFIKQV